MLLDTRFVLYPHYLKIELYQILVLKEFKLLLC